MLRLLYDGASHTLQSRIEERVVPVLVQDDFALISGEKSYQSHSQFRAKRHRYKGMAQTTRTSYIGKRASTPSIDSAQTSKVCEFEALKETPLKTDRGKR